VVKVELPIFLDFLMFKPLLPYPSHIDLLARFSNLPVTMANNQTIESMPNNLAIAVKLNGDMRED
jgi:hypothetical protein